MLLLYSQISSTPVMSLQTGSQLGIINGFIIDPRKLNIAAYYVSGPRVTGTAVLHAQDIREYGPLGFIVDSADEVMELTDDLVRLQEVIRFNFMLQGKNVIDDTKKKLGKVVDFTFDSESHAIQKLHVGQSVVKNISSSGLMIHRSQIIEVTDTHILVRAATIPNQVGLTQMLNPFRKGQNLAAQESSRHQ